MDELQQNEKRFKEAYGKALAQALLKNEEENKTLLLSSNNTSSQDIEHSYLSFCYDDPILPSDHLCRALAWELLYSSFEPSAFESMNITKRPYEEKRGTHVALSDRFVQGVLQVFTKDISKDGRERGGNHHGKDDKSQDIALGDSLSLSSTTVSVGSSGTDLAYVVFVLGPLLSCRILLDLIDVDGRWNDGSQKIEEQSKLSFVRTFLGSYNGIEKKDRNFNDDEDGIKDFTQSMAKMTLPEDSMLDSGKVEEVNENKLEDERPLDNCHTDLNDDINSNNDVGVSLREIFAEESDSDDYDYGDTRFDGVDQALCQTFSAQSMSRSQSISFTDICHRLESLLSNLSCRRFSMSSKVWKEWDASRVLSELTFVLLRCMKRDSSDNEIALHSLGALYTKPLLALRDRAIDSTHQNDALEDFLGLLKTLLRSDGNQVGAFAAKNCRDSCELSPSRIIGLSSLSDLCSCRDILDSAEPRPKALVRVMIMESLDEVIDCLEIIRPTKKPIIGLKPDIIQLRVTMVILPILDFLSGLKFGSDFRTTCDFSKNSISKSDAQIFLQSGFFREVILLYSHTLNDESNQKLTVSGNVVRRKLLRSIFILSAQCQLLGKYAARVPELTNIIFSDSYRETNSFDHIMWCALLSKYTSTNQGPRLRMKGVVLKSSNDLQLECMSASVSIFHDCIDSINSNDDFSLLYELTRFIHCLEALPIVIECWTIAISMSPQGIKDVKTSISNIISELSKIKQNSNEEAKDKSNKIARRGLDVNTIASVRKGCKSVLLNLEQFGLFENISVHRPMSTKMD